MVVTLHHMVRVLVSGPAERAARELRDTGHEIVLAAPGASVDRLAAAAVQEDVLAIGLVETDTHVDAAALPAALAACDADDIVVFLLD